MKSENGPRPCARCRAPIAPDSDIRFRPFCSERCKLLDFGDWISGSYAVPCAADDSAAEGPPAATSA